MNHQYGRTRHGEPRASATGVLRLWLQARPSIVLAVLAVLAPQSHASPVSNFDDIEFWVGTGANQSALAIDWQGTSATDNSLVWGYHWDDAAKGADMLTAIVTADDRLYAKMGTISGFGFGVVGLGYDANNDSQFSLDDDTVFDQHGISSEVPSDGVQALDAADWYAEGWFLTEFWNYGVSATSPFDGGTWERSGSGISSRNLTDGSWDSLAITPIDTQSYALNPLAAELFGDADFDADGRVDGRDFLAWQRGFGLNKAQLSDGDANGDETVDIADLAFWSSQYGTSSDLNLTIATLQGVVSVVPEPSSLGCFCSAVGAWSLGFSRFRFASWRMISCKKTA